MISIKKTNHFNTFCSSEEQSKIHMKRLAAPEIKTERDRKSRLKAEKRLKHDAVRQIIKDLHLKMKTCETDNPGVPDAFILRSLIVSGLELLEGQNPPLAEELMDSIPVPQIKIDLGDLLNMDKILDLINDSSNDYSINFKVESCCKRHRPIIATKNQLSNDAISSVISSTLNANKGAE